MLLGRRTTLSVITLCLAPVGPLNAQVPTVTIDRDNVVINQSCVIRAGESFVVDEDNNGVIHVEGENIVITFVDGAVLRGDDGSTEPDMFRGIGIRIDGQDNVTLRNIRVRGFKLGVYATECDNLEIAGGDISDNFAQRLRSTPQAEVSSDWLYPHNNDDHEWMTRYGAGIYIENSDNVIVHDVRARRGQNGIILDTVENGRIYDNDCSFLSGWGLALWRSSHNTITNNAFDFCIRGYSHGVYNRGQDSAGILMFEQNNDNIIADNSVTHGGDGVFGFGGSLESEGRTGNNGNLFINNDLSYAAAHGLEMTFSFDNRVYENRFVENAICGIWGGYSQDTQIVSNEFIGNGDMGYGAERGGINIEHGANNRIDHNRFSQNRCGVFLWWDPDEGLMSKPWCKANERGSADNVISNNRFVEDEVAIQLRSTTNTSLISNLMQDVKTEIDKDDASDTKDLVGIAMMPIIPEYTSLGTTKPVGARAHLAGRENIIMTPWWPWDHESPLVRRIKSEPDLHVYEFRNFGMFISVPDFGDAVEVETEHVEDAFRLSVRPRKDGVTSYHARFIDPRNSVMTNDFNRRIDVGGTFVRATWAIKVFPWTIDPRDDLDGWHEESNGPDAIETTASMLDLKYAGGGPAQMNLSDAISNGSLGGDRFGTIATTQLTIPAGTWRVSTVSDDGVRVWIDEDRIIDNWTHHGPTRDDATITLAEPREVSIRVEHFEIDGYAWLEFDVEPVSE